MLTSPWKWWQRPASESIASAIRAPGLWKPNARLVINRICVLIASTRALQDRAVLGWLTQAANAAHHGLPVPTLLAASTRP
jgi:hypothetical protein